MSLGREIELIVCDMAGTTIDDHGSVYDALRAAVEETGTVVDAADLQRWMGTEKSAAIRGLLDAGGNPAGEQTVAAAFERFTCILAARYAESPPVAVPGVEAAFAALRDAGMMVALTTGFTREVATAVLDAVGWQIGDDPGIFDGQVVVDALVTGSDVAAGRPAPYLIFHAMEQLGVHDVARVVSVGDTVVDLLSAAHAGVTGVGVTSGALDEAGFGDAPRTAVLESVAELPTWLQANGVVVAPRA